MDRISGPIPSLKAVAHAAACRPGFTMMDVGRTWTVMAWGGGALEGGSDWAEAVRRQVRPVTLGPDLPFAGGVIGWIGYEAGRWTESMPEPVTEPSVPNVALRRVDGALCFHHPSEEWKVGGTAAFQREAAEVLAEGRAFAWERPPTPAVRRFAVPDGQKEGFVAGVDTILAAIRAGRVYQVNLAWEKCGIPVADPLGRWLMLRETNPAHRGAFLVRGDTTVLCNSPELFLEVEAGEARSEPIKGTAPRSGGQKAQERLQNDPKERAELTMIVDLVRNDLGRVAQPGTVRSGRREIRACGDLWHAVQEVSATLRTDTDAVDAFCACFPPGSVTGAPKVEAMRVIRELEPVPRGVYTGAIGWFSDGGGAHFNVAIRTATIQAGQARFHAGAGIVADSIPMREWAETLAKGRALEGALRTHEQAETAA